MNKLLQGQCRACGGHIEFAAEAVGTTTVCPHCGKQTDLVLTVPMQEPAVPLRSIVYTCITILILIGGLIAAIIALKRAERMVGRNPAAPPATAPASHQNN
jgi:hypothetical protein